MSHASYRIHHNCLFHSIEKILSVFAFGNIKYEIVWKYEAKMAAFFKKAAGN